MPRTSRQRRPWVSRAETAHNREVTHSHTENDAAERLRRRYPRSRLPRPALVILVGLLAAAAMGWLIWAATVHSAPAVAAQVLGYRVVSDTQIDVTITVDRPDPSLPVSCRLVAQASDFDRVAEQDVRVEGTAERLVDVTISLTTLRRATGASVNGCDLTG